MFGQPYDRSSHFEQAFPHRGTDIDQNLFDSSANTGMPQGQNNFMTQFENPSNIDNLLKGTEYDIFGQADRPSLNNQLFGLRGDD